MDKKLINYILIVVIVLILSYFFKNMLVKGTTRVGNAALSLFPSFDFIYV